MPYLIAIAVLVLLYIFFFGIWSKNWNPIELIYGADNKPSSSKLQFLLWTVVVIFSYVAVYSARALQGYRFAIDQIPDNLMITMGLSIATASAAKGITAGYVQSGRLAKGDIGSKRGPLRSVVTDDDGNPDLSKLQMLAWTFVAIGIYITSVIAQVNKMPFALTGVMDAGKAVTWSTLTKTFLDNNKAVAQSINLPDISGALMTLMGLGNGAFIGKKLVSNNVTRLAGLSPTAGSPGSEVVVSASNLSPNPGGNVMTLNGKPMEPPADPLTATGTPSQIKFSFPKRQPDGAIWTPGSIVHIGVVTDGQVSVNTLDFTVSVPVLNHLSGSFVKVSDPITLFGSAFGDSQAMSQVLIGTVPANVVKWSNTRIDITLPCNTTAGQHEICVAVAGRPQTNALTFSVI